MTAIDFRYSKIGYVALNVSDVDRSEAFYGPDVVGLAPSGRHTNGASCFRCSEDHHNLILYKGDNPGLKRIGWQLETEDDLESLRARLLDHGIEVNDVHPEECEELQQGKSYRIVDPHSKATFEFYSLISVHRGQPFTPTVCKIARLGHAVCEVPSPAESRIFYEDILNFKVSDFIGDNTIFYRCWPNPYHHTWAVNRGKRGPQFNHVNFMVTEIDDIGAALGRFHRHDVSLVWGPGRHPASGQMFLYFSDPDGITVEYSFGGEEFSAENPRPPQKLAPILENIDHWGAPMLRPIGEVGHVEQL